MAKYKIWNGTDDIYTPVAHFTPEQWREQWPWAKIPGVKVVIAGGKINGAFCQEFDTFKNQAIKSGVAITDDMTDDEVLAAIEAFENTVPVVDDTPSLEERAVAALECQTMLLLPDDETATL